MTKNEVRQKLKNVIISRKLIKSYSYKLAELRSDAERITSAYSLAPGGNSDGNKIESSIMIIMEAEEKLYAERQRYINYINEAMDLIDKLEDIAKAIMVEKYLNGKSWVCIAINLGYSKRQIFRIHGKALEKLSERIKITT